jgi:long-chain acyl-CoA synthetase
MSTVTPLPPPRRRERRFGNRVVWCFAERPASIYSAFMTAAQRHPSATAIRFADSSWTYREVEAEAARLAAGLEVIGVRAGDHVALQLRNRPEFVFLFLAIQRLAAVAVPIDARLQGVEVGHVLADSQARLWLHDRDLLDRQPDALRLAPGVVAVVVPNGGEAPLFAHARATSGPAPSVVDEDRLALILYTSGTTGKPKGAAVAHVNLVHSILHHAGNLGLGPEDRSLVAVPLTHITGLLCGVLAPLSTGGMLILLPHFKAGEFLAAAAETRMTYTIMVPAMYSLCLRAETFDRCDLGAWRIGHFGGAQMPQSTIDALRRRLPGLQLVNGYGATETCSPAAMWPVGQEVPIASVGRPMPCAEILIVDPDTGIEVSPGEAGEIWIRGPMVIKEYWNNPKATQEGLVAGFWRSGDVGCVDAAGNLYVHDRLKDLINRGGYKIYSAEVENVLLQCPGVVEAAVLPRSDPVLGERVHAVLCTTREVPKEELAAFCAQRLADYKVPESWSLSSQPLPRTATGKVDKRHLRAQLS